MYKSTRENHGKYTLISYVRRAWELCSPQYFVSFGKQYGFGTMVLVSWLFDYYWCLVRYGATVTDYFEYEFWKKRHSERKTYVTMLYSRKIQKLFNKGDVEVFLDKVKFNKAYVNYGNISSYEFVGGGMSLS